MKKISILLGLWCVVFQLFSQIPTVPNQMVFAGIDLSISNSARSEIQETVNKIHGNATFFHRMVAQADIYFPVIEAEFAKTQFPDQIKYLCIQESSFKAEAVSTSNAVGYWQFKEATAIEQGLIVDRHIDERKNIASSSFAAAKYISAHNKALDNWIFAVVAYNTGLGGVKQFYDSKYAGKNKMEINKETHWYFLKFLAHVIAYQDFVGKNTPAIKLQVYNQTSGKSIKDFAEEHNTPLEELKPFNLWINEHHKITDEKNIPVIVPISYIPFAQTENKKDDLPIEAEKVIVKSEPLIISDKPVEVAVDVSSAPKQNMKYSVNGLPAITAVAGDNSSILAIKADISREKFLKYNEMKSFEELLPGQTYFLKKKRTKSNALYHTAKEGEDLWMISQHYGIREKSLRSKNRMSKYESVQPGRVIWLHSIRPESVPVEYKELPKKMVTKPVVEAKEKVDTKTEVKKETESATDTLVADVEDEKPAKYLHWVQPQETLAMIARLYQVEPQEIITWNTLESDSVNVGMKLKIYESELSVKIIADSTLDESIEELENQPKIEIIQPKEVAPEATENRVLETTTGVPIVRKTMNFKSILLEPGTTLYGLSREYKVSVEEIKAYNNITGNSLNAGDTILIPIYSETVAEAENLKTYVVQQGDTYYSISKKLGVSIEEIKVKNNKNDSSLKVGEQLKY